MAMSLTSQRTVAPRSPSAAAVDPQEVARVAYALYEQRGRQDGHDFEDWVQAEQLVRAQQGNGSRRSA